MNDSKWICILCFIVAVAVAVLCWQIWKPKTVFESPMPMVALEGGAIQLERKPDAGAQAAVALPKGSKLVRKVTVTVQAKNPVQAISGSVTVETTQEVKAAMPIAPVEQKTPVTVDIALVRNEDDTESVIASSPDGTILGGIDVPVSTAAVQTEKPWAAGIMVEPFKQLGGVFVDRDFGPFRFGVEVMQASELNSLRMQGWFRAGIRF